RLRPILMTTLAMLAGMFPMALGIGEGGEQNAPLGRAVLGGLAASTVATLLVLPAILTVIHGRTKYRSASLDPDDEGGTHFEKVAVDRGSVVKEGEVLTSISVPELEDEKRKRAADVKVVESEIASAIADGALQNITAKRMEKLVADNAVSVQELDVAKAKEA